MADKLKIFNASAGSGKTYTLVTEYLKLILDHPESHHFKRILAMTFTNKAANEMKERIMDALVILSKPRSEKTESDLKFLEDKSKELKIEKSTIESNAPKILNAILHNYSGFSIMTIDKFTHKIIRTFARDLNLSMDFDVDVDLDTLRRNVTDLLFNEIGKNEELTALMVGYANDNLNEDKSWDFSKSLFEFTSEIFKENAIKAIEVLNKVSYKDFVRISKELLEDRMKFETSISGVAKEALKLIFDNGLDVNDFKGKTKGVMPFFERIADKNLKGPSASLLGYYEKNEWAHPDSPNASTVESISGSLSKLFDEILYFLDEPLKEYNLKLEIQKHLNNLSLLKHIMELVEEIKEEENTLLISDFYKKIADVIREEPVPFIYERLGVRYDHFLLDEFQDTSYLQWLNIIPLVYDSLSNGKENLIVGDGKQAIYRWRNGEVDQFVGLPNKIYNPENIETLNEAASKFKEEGKVYPLEHNYRSAPEIVNFNNDLFNFIISSCSDYLKNIYRDVTQKPVKTHQGYVELLLPKEIEPEAQFDFTLDAIKRSIEKGYHLSDICILTKNKKNGAWLAGQLTERGFKVLSPDSLFIGNDHSVKFIFNLTCALSSPLNRNYKIKALEHFSRIIKKEPRELLVEIGEELNAKSISELIQKFGFEIKQDANHHNIFELTETLISTFKLPLADNPFLQFYLEKIHEFEKSNSSNLREFISWFRDKGHEESIVSPKGADAIQVMTIHKSKGLQFPVVICPFFDWQMNLSRQMEWIIDEGNDLPAYFIKMSKRIEESTKKDVFEREQEKFLLDNLNMLYVALTRAENALFVCGKQVSRSPAREWLVPFLEQSGLSKNEDRYFQGKLCARKEEAEKADDLFDVAFFNQINQKPQLSFQSDFTEDRKSHLEKKEFGTKVHYILSQLQGFDDLEDILVKNLNKGKIKEEDKEKILEHVSELFKNDHFKSYFENLNSMNEKEIIDAKGRKHIPDKIIQKDDHLLVVDFKTGQESDKYIEQVQSYVALLRKVGYPKVKGEIFYTESCNVISDII